MKLKMALFFVVFAMVSVELQAVRRPEERAFRAVALAHAKPFVAHGDDVAWADRYAKILADLKRRTEKLVAARK